MHANTSCYIKGFEIQSQGLYSSQLIEPRMETASMMSISNCIGDHLSTRIAGVGRYRDWAGNEVGARPKPIKCPVMYDGDCYRD